MTFWLILAAMTAAAIAALAWPFLSSTKIARSGSDLAVYRDQLEEIERDRAAGLIGKDEAEASRLEVSRRLIKAAGGLENAAAAPVTREFRLRRLSTLLSAALMVPLVSAGLYYYLGTPEAARPKVVAATPGKPGDASIEEMIAKVEGHLQRNPSDGRSWEVLAPVYMRLGRYDDAVRAWRSAITANGESSERQENLGESLVAAAGGVVTDEAKAAFDEALAQDKDAVAARYYRGLAALQDGRSDEAGRMWRELLASAPPGATWAESVRQSLTRLDSKTTQAGAPPAPGPSSAPSKGEPSAQQMQDAAKLSDDQQNDMVRTMVERLAARLKLNGDDPEGWARLVRSYNVIGAPAMVAKATDDARKALAASPVKLAMFEDAIQALGQSDAASPAPPPARPPVAAAPSAQPEPDKSPADMVQAMVARLAGKLKQNGDDPEGWLRLVRSYGVLGDKDKTDAAIVDARKALAGDADKLGKFEDGLKALAAQPR